MRAKPWYLSRTMLFNLLVASLALAESQLQLLAPAVSKQVYAVLAFALPLANLWLRIITTKPLTFSGPEQRP